MITFYAGGLPHFANYLAPIYKALPDSIRGSFHARSRAATRAVQLGIEPIRRPPQRAALVVVASFEDHRAVAPSPTVMVNHGVGQTYTGDIRSADHPSYSGGRDRERVVLNLCPSARDAKNCQADSVVIGPPPYLDRFFSPAVRNLTSPAKIAISFHADIHVCPETRWAFPYYKDALIELARSGEYNLIGHCHPRVTAFLEPFWRRLKVPFLSNWEDVLDQADLYVCDNSSTLYEFAATNRPVLVLTAPWYRRNVHHGLRFWDAIPGYTNWDCHELSGDLPYVLLDGPNLRSIREKAVNIAYDGLLDGKSTDRAVQALIKLVKNGY